ncbi:MAG: hypothetical protein ACRDTT_15235, partial [Pseudonocardiaceae bacterium]
IGWTHAAAHLRHYLDNSGGDLEVSPDQMMRDVDRFRGEVDKTTAAEMRRIAAEAEANGTYGKPIQFSSGRLFGVLRLLRSQDSPYPPCGEPLVLRPDGSHGGAGDPTPAQPGLAVTHYDRAEASS